MVRSTPRRTFDRTLRFVASAGLLLSPLLGASPFGAEEFPPGPTLVIQRAAGPIDVDGQLTDTAWQSVTPIEEWYETNPGDNLPPKVKSVARLAYDDAFFYAAFEFHDPAPDRIRAPLGDRDNISGDTDYGGVILDTRHDGKTGLLLLANPRGIQYDAVTDDVTGNEDSSPDYFWDSRARITESGWVLEIRVPFSSLRYPEADPQTWGILLYRNYPREFRYQIFSAKLPRGRNCFICNENTLSGLSGLSPGGHIVVAPYASASQLAHPAAELGSPLETESTEAEAGVDVKWTPNAQTAVDATLNPDFSQVESDVAQISANERFALFFPEKRPFFLEGVELLATPIQAVSTRTITSPRWGARTTGKIGSSAYTVLVADDRGGGSVVIPGTLGSDLVEQDFESTAFIGRVRRDIARSFVSFLATDREVEGGAYNRVAGPDFQWRPTDQDTITGQYLLSRTRNPDRPDLTPAWTGQDLASHAAALRWSHSTSTIDWFTSYQDVGDDFRADNGFVPQVGYREGYGEIGYTFRPTGPITRVRTFGWVDRSADMQGDLLLRQYATGCGLDGPRNSFARVYVAFDQVNAGFDPVPMQEVVLPRRRLFYVYQISPSRALSGIELSGYVGRDIDFANLRPGDGADVSLRATVRPTNHLELRLIGDRRWLDVDARSGESGRLFTADVLRLRAVYTFTARSFVRLIGQYVSTERDPDLYDPVIFPVPPPPRSAAFTGSALFSYKVNWQSVLFVGYGDTRELSEADRFERSERQFFMKVSYAFQG